MPSMTYDDAHVAVWKLHGSKSSFFQNTFFCVTRFHVIFFFAHINDKAYIATFRMQINEVQGSMSIDSNLDSITRFLVQ